jgi:glyoxylase-like metal-dependent hydrolase (beta-lactamase superfamily II)
MELYPGLEVLDTPFEANRQINICLFSGRRRLLVDTGVAGTPTATLLPALADLGVGVDDLDLVINLHAHADHVGGNGELFAASGETLAFCAHELDAPAIEDHQLLATRVYGLTDPERIRALLARCGSNVPVARWFEGGEIVDLEGLAIQVIHAPGHTRGNLALYDAAHHALVHGESVMGVLPTNPGGQILTLFGADPAEYRKTLETLRALDFEIYVSSHQPVGDRSTGLAAIEISLDALDRFEAVCQEAIAQGPRDVDEMASAVAREGGYAPGPRLAAQVRNLVDSWLLQGRVIRRPDGSLVEGR